MAGTAEQDDHISQQGPYKTYTEIFTFCSTIILYFIVMGICGYFWLFS